MSDSSLTRRALMGGAAAGAGAVALGASTFIADAATSAPAATPAPRAAGPLNDTMTTDAAWAAFLGTSDLAWTHVPTSFYQGAFLGNGGLGAAVYQTGTAKRITWRLGDTRVRDHQGTGGTLFGNARLPVGDLTLNTTGDVTAVNLRQSLWHAELHGTVTTTAGVLNIRAFICATRDVLVVSASGTEKVSWKFTPATARSRRLVRRSKLSLKKWPIAAAGNEVGTSAVPAQGRSSAVASVANAGATALRRIAIRPGSMPNVS